MNHPLVDDNKPLGSLAVVVFYGLNDIDLQIPDDDAYDLVIDVAGGHAEHQVAARHLAKWHGPLHDRAFGYPPAIGAAPGFSLRRQDR